MEPCVLFGVLPCFIAKFGSFQANLGDEANHGLVGFSPVL